MYRHPQFWTLSGISAHGTSRALARKVYGIPWHCYGFRIVLRTHQPRHDVHYYYLTLPVQFNVINCAYVEVASHCLRASSPSDDILLHIRANQKACAGMHGMGVRAMMEITQ